MMAAFCKHLPVCLGGGKRSLGTLAFFGLLVAGCSSTPASTTADSATVATSPPTVAETRPPVTAPPQADKIAMTLEIGDEMESDEYTLTEANTSDPFGTFGSCSGLRSRFGAFSVVMSGSEQLGGSVQLSTSENPFEAGSVEAVVRIERDDSSTLIPGVLELVDDLSRGHFEGVTADEIPVIIDFSCTSGRIPQPIDRTRPYVEVATRLTMGSQERVLSLGVGEPCVDGVIDLEVGEDEAVAFGPFRRVYISADKLVLQIGSKPLDIAEFSVSPGADGAGTFAGSTTDGIDIVGAYSCSG